MVEMVAPSLSPVEGSHTYHAHERVTSVYFLPSHSPGLTASYAGILLEGQLERCRQALNSWISPMGIKHWQDKNPRISQVKLWKPAQ
jgi:hypothetical protein